MKKIAQGIVKSRWILMALFIVLAGVACWGVTKVNTNYDIIKYLPAHTETVLALDKMEDEFGSVGTAQLMVKNISADKIDELKLQIEALKGIKVVVAGDDEATYKDGNALFKLFLVDSSFSPEAKDTVREVRALLADYDIAMNGGAVSSEFLQSAIQTDMIVILLVACIIIAIILLITSTSWVDPLVFGLVVGVSLVLNLGSNAILPEVSFITKAICAIMQLALAMDYSIILLHRFNEERKRTLSNKEAMVDAIRGSFSSVVASSLTTIAGLVALVFMRFTIGRDVGIVLTKGIIISLLSVFLFMPGILLMFAPLIDKTRHKTLQTVISEKAQKSKDKRQARFDEQAKANPNAKPKKAMGYIDFAFKLRKVIPVVLLVLVVAGAIMNSNVKYSYALETSRDPEAQVNAEDKMIEDLFGKQNSLVVLVPTGKYEKEKELLDFMNGYTYKGEHVINGAQGMVSMGFNTAIPTDILKTVLSDADYKELMKRCDVPDSSAEIYLVDILRAVNKPANKTYVTELLRRALVVVDNVFNMVPESYNPTGFANTLNGAIRDLAPGVQLTEERSQALYEACGFEADETVSVSTLLQAIADNNVIGGLLEDLMPSLAGTVQSLVEMVAGLADKVDEQMTAEAIAALIPLGDMTESIKQLMTMNGNPKTLSVHDLVKWIGANSGASGIAGGIARGRILDAINGQLDLAFTMFESKANDATGAQGGMTRIMFNLNMNTADDDSFAAMKEITAKIKEIYEGDTVYIGCETAAYSDIKDYFQVDSTVINLISFFAILIIILLSFMSFGVPVILTLLIQGAIWLGMSIQFMAGASGFFVCYLVVMCIQMGATVDYAILLTNRYVNFRATMGRVEAMKNAFSTSIVTIMTSGSIMTIAAFVVGLISKVAIIADLGMMLAIGCLLSIIMIVLALPSVLMLCDKFLQKTALTKKGRHFFDEKKGNDDRGDKDDRGDGSCGGDGFDAASDDRELSGFAEAGGRTKRATLCGLEEVEE